MFSEKCVQQNHLQHEARLEAPLVLDLRRITGLPPAMVSLLVFDLWRDSCCLFFDFLTPRMKQLGKA